ERVGPMTETVWPSPTGRSPPCSARTPPNRRVRSRTSSISAQSLEVRREGLPAGDGGEGGVRRLLRPHQPDRVEPVPPRRRPGDGGGQVLRTVVLERLEGRDELLPRQLAPRALEPL